MSTSSSIPPDSLDSDVFGGCEQLSPHNLFLSTVLTSFIGAIVTGATGGWLLAFCTAWISWFATPRILIMGIWFVSRALCGLTLGGCYSFYPQDLVPSDGGTNPPTLFGWVGWVYASCYFPIVQILWLAGNWGNGHSPWNLKIVRALSISVTSLALTMDTKARFAVYVGERFGVWAQHTFTAIHAFSTLSLGVVAVIMLIVGVTQWTDPNRVIISMLIIFAFLWMLASFVLFPPIDGGMAPTSVRTFVEGLAMGIFAGLFTSAAAFVAMQSASKDGAAISAYLKCEGVEAWRKFIAIFP